jgi:hypothetical protein
MLSIPFCTAMLVYALVMMPLTWGLVRDKWRIPLLCIQISVVAIEVFIIVRAIK